MRHIDLNPNLERRLSELANRTGRTANDLIEEGIEDLEGRYLASVSREERPAPSTTEQTRKELGATRARAWLDAVKTFPHTPPLSDEAISRESMYSARG